MRVWVKFPPQKSHGGGRQTSIRLDLDPILPMASRSGAEHSSCRVPDAQRLDAEVLKSQMGLSSPARRIRRMSVWLSVRVVVRPKSNG